jgi:hypothetical protein
VGIGHTTKYCFICFIRYSIDLPWTRVVHDTSSNATTAHRGNRSTEAWVTRRINNQSVKQNWRPASQFLTMGSAASSPAKPTQGGKKVVKQRPLVGSGQDKTRFGQLSAIHKKKDPSAFGQFRSHLV